MSVSRKLAAVIKNTDLQPNITTKRQNVCVVSRCKYPQIKAEMDWPCLFNTVGGDCMWF